jgi:large subunit ribosomal protein L36e
MQREAEEKKEKKKTLQLIAYRGNSPPARPLSIGGGGGGRMATEQPGAQLGLSKHHSVAVGPSRGYPVRKRALPEKPSRRKGKLGARTKMVREVVKEVAGQAPYERRLLELLRVGREKRALKVAKKKVNFL